MAFTFAMLVARRRRSTVLSSSWTTCSAAFIIDVPSKEETVKLALQISAHEGDVVKVRKILDMSDFPEEVQNAIDED
ncbi:MAG: hypothetical protein GC165_00800 [Armatimonadetes bacterium]|nr:hypothetical protein [Armatimonadota bacterium]